MTLLFELDFIAEYPDEIGIAGRNIDPHDHAMAGMQVVAYKDPYRTAEPVELREPFRVTGGIMYGKRIDGVPAGCTGMLLVARNELETAREDLIAAFGDVFQSAGSQSKGTVRLLVIQ